MRKMGFFRCIGRAFKECLNFKGRSSRKEFYSYFLFYFIMFSLIYMGTFKLQRVRTPDLIIFLVVIFPLFALSARRMHDTGISGFWAILALIPYVGTSAILLYSIRDSEPGENKWGMNPKGVISPSEDI